MLTGAALLLEMMLVVVLLVVFEMILVLLLLVVFETTFVVLLLVVFDFAEAAGVAGFTTRPCVSGLGLEGT